ncbi:hybrid sensor histidine kinase/response regulator [Actinoplanes derwentensis]|uniref:histidine kinase n=1 Tax=Actinoplanes derwentensis TaxID=113562 RepID=A0A1H2CWG0_9ACTN|nr:PAS domain-containing sensor histidine kinase [Actinoplanes derwentensis]GID88346.1 hypothetical protein Ade03nite_72700 [Actinoplanes derwentensis]SDT74659.1 PAS domain S-box-containing protein [Actinoplanes derwentensis]
MKKLPDRMGGAIDNFVEARPATGHALLVGTAVAAVTALAVTDIVFGVDNAAVGLLAVGPCLAAVAAGSRAVAGVGGYALLWSIGLTWGAGETMISALHVQSGVALVGATVLSVIVAHRRQVLQAAAAKAEAGRRMLAAVVECSDDAVIAMNLEATIESWNSGAQRMFGYRADEVIGTNIAIITPRAGMTSLPALFARIRRGEVTGHYETRAVRRDGTRLDVSASFWQLRDATGAVCGAAASCRDITESKRAGEAQRVLAAVVDGSDDAIVAKTLDGTITAWNPGAQRMYGYRPDEAIGRNITLITLPEESAELVGILARLADGEHIDHYETRRVRKDGTVLNVSVSISPICDDNGTVTGASAITRDITDRMRAEAERRDLAERSQHAQRLQSLGHLAGGIAHDFNNLLAIILNYSAFIIDVSDTGDAVRADAQKIRTAAERGTALTRQLLVFARGEPASTRRFDLNTVVADAQNLLERTIGADITLIARPASHPAVINADRGQIDQALLNLVLNARDAMPDGGTLIIEVGTTDLDDTAIDLQPALPLGSYARVLVSDTGVGMSREVTRHILEPFFTTKPKGRGTGLGLATVYGIVTQAGGGLNIYSEVGIGTTIRLYLPLADNPATSAETAEPDLAPDGTGQVIMVVDDEDALRAVIQRALNAHGYAALTASGGAEALSLLADHHVDLLLSDMIMPHMSGRQLAQQARQRFPDLPVLFMSGYSDGQLTDQQLITNAAELLQKPFVTADLLRAVHTCLTGQHPTAGIR